MEDPPKRRNESFADAVSKQQDIRILLGLALLLTQEVEFALYGVASLFSHNEVGQKNRRFKTLTPETFMSGNLDELKATLGQLVKVWGDVLMIKTARLNKYCDDRNLIIHNFRRVYMMNIKGKPPKQGGAKFLKDFIIESSEIANILLGLIQLAQREQAIKKGRLEELDFGAKEEANINAYQAHAVKYQLENSSIQELIELLTVKPK